jgi:general secretion pathway protein G
MPRRLPRSRGFTLIEMLVTLAVLAILASAVIPLGEMALKREKEIELKRDLRLLREAIDAYKKRADEKKFDFDEETMGYPPDLETLVKGVEVKTQEQGKSETKKVVKFLRRIPRDPMTGTTDWGLRSYQDKPDSTTWGEENVYDVYTKSQAKAIDGTKYSDW